MGATITTGKLAAASMGADGEIYYFLFEETYDKNCYPHTPEWSCMYFGTIAGALRRIFLCASSCESGMLRSRRGEIVAENYIAAWLKELANPVEFSDQCFDLEVRDGFMAIIPSEQEQWAIDTFTRHGHKDIAEQLLRRERASLRFSDHAAALSEVFDGDHIGAWRLIRKSAPIHENRCADLGYRPKANRVTVVEQPSVMKIADDYKLLKDDHGVWRCDGGSWSILSSYIAQYWRNELEEPGSYKHRIKALRDSLRSAPTITTGMKVVVDETVELEGYAKTTVIERRALGNPTSTGYEIEVTADVLKDSTLLWQICNLPRKCTSWIAGSGANGQLNDFASKQMDMFA